jgi:tetratricopeptide (TPR) repeat protein
MRSPDIREYLESWEYDPNDNVRIVYGEDGREILQVRIPCGIQQFELEGRPDGKRPYGEESLLDYFEKQLENYIKAHGTDEGFRISHADFLSLYDEGNLYYYRYILCFQLGEFDRTIRDTERNMRLFRFVEKYVEEEDRVLLSQYWPYIIRINKTARAMKKISFGLHREALRDIEEAIEWINNLPPVNTDVFDYEKERSLRILSSLAEEIRSSIPVSERERIMKELEDALIKEDYEKAARLRDLLGRI